MFFLSAARRAFVLGGLGAVVSLAGLAVSSGAGELPVREGLVAWFDAGEIAEPKKFEPAAVSTAWWWEQWEAEGPPFLKVDAPGGIGPLSLPGRVNQPRGMAFITGGSEPDLFVRATGFPGMGLYLFPFSERSPDGTPIFGAPRPVRLDVTHPLISSGSVFSEPDRSVRAIWIEGGSVVFGEFHAETMTFARAGRVPVEGLPRAPVKVVARPNADGSIEAVFEMGDGVRFQPADARPWSEDYRPYDGAGIWRGGMPYRHLWAARFPGFAEGPAEAVRQLSSDEAEVRLNLNQMAAVDFGAMRGTIAGSHYGRLYFVPDGGGKTRELAGPDGRMIRHPAMGAAAIVYPNSGGRPDLIVGGDGGLYFYRFSGEFTVDGRPVYEAAVPLLQEAADLYAGPEPVVSVVDWNGDGRFDIVAGNASGRILFFENTGSDVAPRFLPGEPISAGGREIRIRAGYGGSLAGVGDAGRAYASPTVVDWNGDGLPDVVLGDITGGYTVFMNRGTAAEPRLEKGRPLYDGGLNLHGRWRVRPAVGPLGERMAMVIADAEDHLHLFWRIDDYNVESGGKLLLEDGSFISVSGGDGVETGRAKLSFADWDGDGVPDLLIGAAETNAIPNRQTGFPANGLARRGAVVLFLKNVGTAEAPRFAQPQPIRYGNEVLYPGGGHAAAVATELGGGAGPNLLIGNEAGRFLLLRREHLSH